MLCAMEVSTRVPNRTILKLSSACLPGSNLPRVCPSRCFSMSGVHLAVLLDIYATMTNFSCLLIRRYCPGSGEGEKSQKYPQTV